MRIGMFLDNDFPPDSRVENEAVSLIDAGHEVFLFSISYEGRQAEENINGIQVRRYTGDQWLYKSSAMAYQLPYFHRRLQPRIEKFIQENKLEALHIHDMPLAQAVINVNDRSFHLPLTLDLHENRPVIMQHYKHLKTFPGKYIISPRRWEQKQEELIKKADHVIVVTEEAKNHYTKTYKVKPSKFIVTPNTIHPEIFLKYPTDNSILEKYKDTYNLVYVGDTSIRRGTNLLIKALAALKERITNIKLVLVGTSTEQDILDELVREDSLEEYVSFEGWQDVSLFPSYIKTANVCLSPLVRNLHHDTTYANKLFQYMAMGKPVIVSDCPAQARVVRESNCGLIFKADDLDNFIEKILTLYESPDKAQMMGKNGEEAVFNKWNWNQTSKGLIHLYETLL